MLPGPRRPADTPARSWDTNGSRQASSGQRCHAHADTRMVCWRHLSSFGPQNPCKGSSRLSQRGADGMAQGGGTGGTSSIKPQRRRHFIPRAGMHFAPSLQAWQRGDRALPPPFTGVFPIYRGFDGSFSPPFFHNLGWFCEWAIVTGSGRGKGADGEREEGSSSSRAGGPSPERCGQVLKASLA